MTESKILTWEAARQQREEWRRAGESVVFTNGCFDLVHLGHVDYLEKSRAKGERLVVGVNSDASVRRLKGPNRPILDEYARGRLLAALAFVDAVVLFNEETPLELIQTICPDILVKGDDYTIDTIVGADFVLENGGRVETVSLVKGYSTSLLVEHIKKLY
ncbi:rfaE bifunctional protein, domain II [Catalinimonas alkaloidigena]|uniref:D-glycero-beta-D-manno-heptose 1-phosphate adenylyltransferase n=1 Tax=Catalinimonas alkaloidigena TaxID=1075417 RepID=A0A1G9ER03_9BACT|nr:D-glycero-beta-D-manno-heptose 1-phosphate adenylyltransferase [Catalinimonas alkaloidigena]SDK78524.1 rfaE bifunctional protein, domain II [Catalinimonas alkaloidigena]